MSDWIEEIKNPNETNRTGHKHKKSNETVPNYIPSNQPVAHTTRKGKGWVGRLIRRKRLKHEK